MHSKIQENEPVGSTKYLVTGTRYSIPGMICLYQSLFTFLAQLDVDSTYARRYSEQEVSSSREVAMRASRRSSSRTATIKNVKHQTKHIYQDNNNAKQECKATKHILFTRKKRHFGKIGFMCKILMYPLSPLLGVPCPALGRRR